MGDLNSLLADAVSTDSLSSMYEIENVLLILDEINNKQEYYKELKKVRTKSIDEKISALSSKSEVLRQVVLNTMKSVAPDEKTLDFPSIGKVTRRKPKASWSVEDEKSLLEFLESEGHKDEVIKVTTAVDKRKLKPVLDVYRQEGKAIPGVSSVTGKEALTITFEKKKDETVKTDKTEERTVAPEIDVLAALEV